MVPVLVTEMVPKEMTKPVETVVPYDRVVEYVVSETVPYSEPVTTKVRVPTTITVDREVIDKVWEQEEYMLTLDYP